MGGDEKSETGSKRNSRFVETITGVGKQGNVQL